MAFEQRCACLHEIEDTAQRPNVNLMVVSLLSIEQLGCSIEQASYLIRHIFGFPSLFLCHPEINKLEGVEGRTDLKGFNLGRSSTTFAGQHDVGRFDISM